MASNDLPHSRIPRFQFPNAQRRNSLHREKRPTGQPMLGYKHETGFSQMERSVIWRKLSLLHLYVQVQLRPPDGPGSNRKLSLDHGRWKFKALGRWYAQRTKDWDDSGWLFRHNREVHFCCQPTLDCVSSVPCSILLPPWVYQEHSYRCFSLATKGWLFARSLPPRRFRIKIWG